MKNYLLLVLCYSILNVIYSQSDSTSIGEKIFLPSLEIGYIHSNSEFLSDGLLIKTSLEYRLGNRKGLLFRLNYDTYDTNYELENIDNLTNVVNGTAFFSDLILGGGYRLNIDGNLCFLFIFQPGVKFYDFPVATQEGNAITIGQDNRSIFTSRSTLGLEYYLNNKSAISFDLFHNQVWDSVDFWINHRAGFGISLGFITALF